MTRRLTDLLKVSSLEIGAPIHEDDIAATRDHREEVVDVVRAAAGRSASSGDGAVDPPALTTSTSLLAIGIHTYPHRARYWRARLVKCMVALIREYPAAVKPRCS